MTQLCQVKKCMSIVCMAVLADGCSRGTLAQVAALHDGSAAVPERWPGGSHPHVASQLHPGVPGPGGVPHLLLCAVAHEWQAAQAVVPHLLEEVPWRLPVQVVPVFGEERLPSLSECMVDILDAREMSFERDCSWTAGM